MNTETLAKSCKGCTHHRITGDLSKILCRQPRSPAVNGQVFSRVRIVDNVRVTVDPIADKLEHENRECEQLAARCKYFQEER